MKVFLEQNNKNIEKKDKKRISEKEFTKIETNQKLKRSITLISKASR